MGNLDEPLPDSCYARKSEQLCLFGFGRLCYSMGMKNFLLYLSSVLIWGSTWLAIKYQIGDVDPMVSVVYRFGLAAAIMLVCCRAMGLRLAFGLKEHLFMALFGALLFSVNYWFVYVAEVYLTSGLVAVVFSTLVFMNVFNGYLFLGSPIRGPMILGALIGIFGVGLLFWPEIAGFDISDEGLLGLVLSLASVLMASLGNIVSARNQKAGLPVLQANAFAMGYGALIMVVVAITTGKHFTFSLQPLYVGSLIYLAIFGSIVAFWTYLTLLGRIGADKAAYAIMLVPVVALFLSTLFEDYRWTAQGLVGLVLVLGGNLVLLKTKKDAPAKRRAPLPSQAATAGAQGRAPS